MNENLDLSEIPCVLFCGGKGTRLSENNLKPMTLIGDIPIIHHLMNWYAKFGVKKFILLAGYKQEVLKEYFLNYYKYNSDFTISLKDNKINYIDGKNQNTNVLDWEVTVLNTGLDTNTTGRLKAAKPFIKTDLFLLNYSDQLGDVPVDKVVQQHISSNNQITLTGFLPEGRFGLLKISSDNKIVAFNEKQVNLNSFVNGGFFVCNKSIFDVAEQYDDSVQFEKGPLVELTNSRSLGCFKHTGNLIPMDTPRDKQQLIDIWNSGNAFWTK